MKTAVSMLLGLWCLATFQGVSANVAHSVGVARDATDQTLQYVEHHQYLISGEHLVTYFDASAEVIATKVLTYPGLPQHPEIIQSDLVRQVDVTASNSKGTLQMTRTDAGRLNKFEVPLDENTIVDAGFDSFLRSNWDRFEDSTPQRYKFAVAGQPRVLVVDITRQADSGDVTAFIIRPRNFLVRWLVPQIRLLYDQNRRLSAYQGLTNLAGQNRQVSIEFSHFSSPGQLSRPLKEGMPEK